MKANELLQKSVVELNSLRMQKATGQLSKPDQVKKVRRDIARINTVIRAMEG
jgi:large subunit ribosomal protein L29